MMPRRWLIVARILPWNSIGPSTETFMIGSRISGRAFSYACQKPPMAASWKAMSDESTGCQLPSLTVHLTPTIGKPISLPFCQAGAESFIACRDIFVRDHAALDFVDEFIILLREGFHDAAHAGILARAAGLFLMRIIEGDGLGDGFPVGDLRHAGIELDAVFPAHPLDIDLKVQLAHAFDDGFVRFAVDEGPERRVFLCKSVERLAQIVGGFAVFGLDGERDHRFGHEHGRSSPMFRSFSVNVSPEAQSMPNSATISPLPASVMSSIESACMRISRPTLNRLLLRVLNSSDAFPDRTLINADIGELAVLAVFKLEGEGNVRRRRVGRQRHFVFFIIKIDRLVRMVGG